MNREQVSDIITKHFAKQPNLVDIPRWTLENWYPGGTNPKVLATAEDNQHWVMKFCNNNHGRVPEICEREVLISLLGKAVGVLATDAWVIPSACALPLLEQNSRREDHVIRDKLVLMPRLSGNTIEHCRTEVGEVISKNPLQAANIFAFMHWVGDEDRGLGDMMLDDGQLVLIDNGLCGPGPGDKLRGYHPTPEVYNSEMITKKCYGGGKPSFVAFVLRCLKIPHSSLSVAPVIDQISSLSDESIDEFVSRLSLAEFVKTKLISRRVTLRDDYQKWLSTAFKICSPHTLK